MDVFEYYEPIEQASFVFAGLNQQRQDNPELCDFAIMVEGKCFPCHRSVLCLFSSFFRAAISGDFKENAEHVIHLQEISSDVVNSMLDYVYIGKLRLEHSNVEELLLAATRLGFAKVADLCTDYIRHQIDQTNCLEVLKLAKQQNYHILKVSAHQYLIKHLCSVFEYEQAENTIELSDVVELLEDVETHKQGEEAIVLSIMTWLQTNLPHRRAHTSDLLGHVKWNYLPAPFLLKVLLRHPLVDSDDIIKQHVLEHIRRSYDEQKHNKVPVVSLLNAAPGGESSSVTNVPGDLRENSENQVNRTPARSPSYRNYSLKKASREALLLIGGLSLGEAERGDTSQPNVMCFYPLERAWKIYAPWPERGLRGFSVSKFNNNVVVTGGCSTTASKHIVINRVWMFDVANNQWVQLPDMIKPRAFHKSCQVNSQFYAVGGENGNVLNVEIYDDHKYLWKVLKKTVPRMMYNFTASGCNSKLILIGSGQSSTIFLQCYNPAVDSWTVLRSPNVPRHLSAPVSVTSSDESKIFVSGDNTKKLYVFDPNSNTWTRGADMNNLHSNGNLILLGGEIFHTGGHWEEDGYWDEMESYDVAKNVWTAQGALPHLWLYHGCAAIYLNA